MVLGKLPVPGRPTYSKIPLLRPLEIKTTSLFRPVFASPKWQLPYGFIFNMRTTSLIRPLLGSPNGGLNRGISLPFDNSEARAYSACSRCGWSLFGHFLSSII